MTLTLPQAGSLRLASWITAINVLVASGYAVAGLVRPEAILPAGSDPTNASFVFALYAAARTLPLAALTLAAIYKRWWPTLLALGLLAGVIQFVDAIVGFYQHDIGKTVGPLVLGAFQMYAASILRRSVERSAASAT